MLHRLTSYGLLLILAGAMLLLIVDMVQLSTNPDQYRQVYGFTGNETEWSHRSERNYLVRSALLVGFCMVGVASAVWSLRPSVRSYRVLYLYIGLLAVLALLALLRWWQRGFGH